MERQVSSGYLGLNFCFSLDIAMGQPSISVYPVKRKCLITKIDRRPITLKGEEKGEHLRTEGVIEDGKGIREVAWQRQTTDKKKMTALAAYLFKTQGDFCASVDTLQFTPFRERSVESRVGSPNRFCLASPINFWWANKFLPSQNTLPRMRTEVSPQFWSTRFLVCLPEWPDRQIGDDENVYPVEVFWFTMSSCFCYITQISPITGDAWQTLAFHLRNSLTCCKSCFDLLLTMPSQPTPFQGFPLWKYKSWSNPK